MTKKKIRPLNILVGLLVLGIFLGPLVKLLYMSVKLDGSFGLDNYINLLKMDRTVEAIKNTIVIAISVSILSTVIGLILSIVLVYTDIKYKKFLKILILFPFVIPSYVMTLAFTNLFSVNSGMTRLLNTFGIDSINLFSMGGIVFVMTICNIPIIYTILSNTLRKIPRELEWASRTSGYGVISTLFNVNIRSALPAIFAGFILSFLSTLDNFSVPAFLGIPAGIPVLSTYIYEKAIGIGGTAFGESAALSMILAIIAVIAIYFERKFVNDDINRDSNISEHEPRLLLKGNYKKVVQYTTTIGLVMINIVPLVMMVGSSFLPNSSNRFNISGLSLQNYVKLLGNSSIIIAIRNSFILSVLATGICMIVAVLIAYKKKKNNFMIISIFEKSASMTYAVPGIVLSLGMIFFWTEPVPGFKPKIYGTVTILLIAYITRFMIMMNKGANTAFLAVSDDVEEASRVCSASKTDYWIKIVLPMIYRQLLSSGFLVFTAALTELSLSSMLASAGTKTIGLSIYNLQQSGNYNMAYAFSTVVILLIGIAIIPLSLSKYDLNMEKVNELKDRRNLKGIPTKIRT